MIFLEATLPNDFFTMESMLTLSGATGAVFVITNGLHKAFGYNPRWLGLVVALVVTVAGVFFSNGPSSQYFVALVNGFLIYATAGGATSVLASSDRNIADSQALGERKFLSRWW
jgi:Na+/melibiose symporter-like transporter